MAAAVGAVSGAKRRLRAELKQRLRALSAEERLRQSHLLTQKVSDRAGCAARVGVGVCAGAGLGARTSFLARARPSQHVGTLWGSLPPSGRDCERGRASDRTGRVTPRSPGRAVPGVLRTPQWG